MTRAEKKLDPCDEPCTYNAFGKCSFGIRHLGCFNDEGEARTMAIVMGTKVEPDDPR